MGKLRRGRTFRGGTRKPQHLVVCTGDSVGSSIGVSDERIWAQRTSVRASGRPSFNPPERTTCLDLISPRRESPPAGGGKPTMPYQCSWFRTSINHGCEYCACDPRVHDVMPGEAPCRDRESTRNSVQSVCREHPPGNRVGTRSSRGDPFGIPPKSTCEHFLPA